MTTQDFLDGKPFHYEGHFHRLRNFKDDKGKINPRTVVTLKKNIDKPEILNMRTNETWRVSTINTWCGFVNGRFIAPEPCFTVFLPAFGRVTILLSECQLEGGVNV